MKHHCHCGLDKHLQHFRLRRFGVVGGVLIVLHLLLHIVECLILPTVIIAISGHAAEESASATSNTNSVAEETTDTSSFILQPALLPSAEFLTFWQSYDSIVPRTPNK